jgi:hypothetical protein
MPIITINSVAFEDVTHLRSNPYAPPYIAWVTFAAVLAFGLWQLNPRLLVWRLKVILQLGEQIEQPLN